MTTVSNSRHTFCSEDLPPALRLRWTDLPEERKRDLRELGRTLPAAKEKRLREVALCLDAIERAGKISEYEADYHELQHVEQGLVNEALRLRTA